MLLELVTLLKTKYQMTQDQIDLLIGTLLGDANLQTFSQGNTWRYRALQGANQSDYLIHKYELLKEYCGTPPAYGEALDQRTGKVAKRWYFNTLTHDVFSMLGKVFYTWDSTTKLWVKIVPADIASVLTPGAVAYWFMDDGSLKKPMKAMRISTQGFKEADFRRLQLALYSVHGIVTSAHRRPTQGDPDRFVLYIPVGSADKFNTLVRPYLLDCMKYKVKDVGQS